MMTEPRNTEQPADAAQAETPVPPRIGETPARSPSTTSGGFFRKRPNAIGPAPAVFEILLGLMFGASLGLLIGYPIVGAFFGAGLGGLYALVRYQQRQP